jgi:regulator of sigma E protease
MSLFLIIFGLILFVSLVVVHEFGHFIMARRNGVEVEEFGIGFPPKVWGKKLKSGMLFSVNLLPLGGFVRLKGEHDMDKQKGSYGSASLKVKTKIILAGVLMNLLVAIVMFSFIALIGMPKLVENQFTVKSDTKIFRNDVLVGVVEDDSPADIAGLWQRDKLTSISLGNDTRNINSSQDLPNATSDFAGQEVTISFTRDEQQKTTQTTLRTKDEVEKSKQTDDPKGYLGVVPTEYTLQRSTWSAPIVGVGVTKQFTELTLKGLYSVVSGLFKGDTKQATSQVAGPVGIFVLLKEGSRLGVQFVLMIIAVISLTLAIMNALPIPALDGGRLFVTYLYRVIKKPLTPKAEELIHGAGFAVLMLLFVLITVLDVKRFL